MPKTARSPAIVGLALSLGACAATAPKVPYPAFVDTQALPDVFVAGLPGSRARQLAGDPRGGRAGYRLLLPPDWAFGTGASPDRSVELFVLRGRIALGELSLDAGGYAYLPPGFTGMNLESDSGAELLYFIDDADPRAVIRTPLISSVAAGRWLPASDDPEDFGLSVLELRRDPGSGVRTWLLKQEPVAAWRWQKESQPTEGYLLSGDLRHSECVDGQPATGDYAAGGYFMRPAGAVHGGPQSRSAIESIWYLRSPGEGERAIVGACIGAEP